MSPQHFDEISDLVPLPSDAGLLVLGTRQNGAGWLLVAVDPTQDRVLWETPIGSRQPPNGGHIAARGRSLFVACEGQLWHLDLATGVLRWNTPLPGDLEQDVLRWKRPGCSDELAIELLEGAHGWRVACLCENDLLQLFDLDAGTLLLSRQAEHASVLPGEGVLVQLDEDLSFYDAQGEQRWSREAESHLALGGRILVTVEDDDTELHCIDPRSGDSTWHVVDDELQDVDDVPFVSDRAVITLNTSKGHRLWTVPTARKPAPPPTNGGFFAKLFGGGSRGAALPVPGATASSDSLLIGDKLVLVMDGDNASHMAVLGADDLRPQGPVVNFAGPGSLHLRPGGALAVMRHEGQGDQALLRGLAGNGATIWERQLPGAREHFCLGEQLVVKLPRQVALLDVTNGETLSVFAS